MGLTAAASDTPYVNLSNISVSQDMLELLPRDLAERYMTVPIGEIKNKVAVAMLDVDNIQALDFIASKINRPIKPFLASEEGIRKVLAQYSINLKEGVRGLDDQAKEAPKEASDVGGIQDINSMVQDSPISRALTTILEYAAKNRSSDIHVEPLEKSLKIRCRVDGVLREIMQLPKSIEAALISRVKILANLKIDEHRIPQDGQFSIKLGDKEVDLRIAISPVLWASKLSFVFLIKAAPPFGSKTWVTAGKA